MIKILFPIATILLMASCQKVIDVDLNSATPRIVIEAALQENTVGFTVHITQTGNYFGTDQPKTINTATVTLKKGTDNPITLANEGNGIYTAASYVAEKGKSYLLTVIVDGTTYEATSYLPVPVPLDELVVQVSDQPSFGSPQADSFQVFCHFQEPLAEANFYRIKTIVNDIPSNKGENLLVLEDRLTNGNYIRIPVFTETYKLNDKVEVELVSMDAKMYDYFNSLSGLVSNGNSSAAPTNPNTNWSGGALGYFGAFSSSKKTVIVQ